MDRELLIEIGLEELPASWLPNLTRQMAEKLEARLKDLRIAPLAPIESFATARRRLRRWDLPRSKGSSSNRSRASRPRKVNTWPSTGASAERAPSTRSR